MHEKRIAQNNVHSMKKNTSCAYCTCQEVYGCLWEDYTNIPAPWVTRSLISRVSSLRLQCHPQQQTNSSPQNQIVRGSKAAKCQRFLSSAVRFRERRRQNLAGWQAQDVAQRTAATTPLLGTRSSGAWQQRQAEVKDERQQLLNSCWTTSRHMYRAEIQCTEIQNIQGERCSDGRKISLLAETSSGKTSSLLCSFSFGSGLPSTRCKSCGGWLRIGGYKSFIVKDKSKRQREPTSAIRSLKSHFEHLMPGSTIKNRKVLT